MNISSSEIVLKRRILTSNDDPCAKRVDGEKCQNTAIWFADCRLTLNNLIGRQSPKLGIVLWLSAAQMLFL